MNQKKRYSNSAGTGITLFSSLQHNNNQAKAMNGSLQYSKCFRISSDYQAPGTTYKCHCCVVLLLYVKKNKK